MSIVDIPLPSMVIMETLTNDCLKIMFKILLLAIAIWLIIKIVKAYQQNLENQSSAAKNKTAPEEMVRCKNCGVHHPISESFLVNGHYFCSLAHSKKSK
jgi:uncharacterized protein